jgi:hypothetical protein
VREVGADFTGRRVEARSPVHGLQSRADLDAAGVSPRRHGRRTPCMRTWAAPGRISRRARRRLMLWDVPASG